MDEQQQQQLVGLAAVTVAAVLEQGDKRPEEVSRVASVYEWTPQFERVFRAQVNCSEYFPLFIAILWTSGVFFSQGASCVCGAAYVMARLCYFQGYAESPQQRLRALRGAGFLWLLIGFSCVGVLLSFWRLAGRLQLLN